MVDDPTTRYLADAAAAKQRKELARASKPRGGSSTLYKAEFVKAAKRMSKAGATNAELGDEFGVSADTISKWMTKHLEFGAAVRVGKTSFDDRVERSLANRAVGYTYESEKLFQHEGKVLREPIIEHVPPDVAASFIWLKNRRPDKWRDRHEVHISMGYEFNMDLTGIQPVKDITGEAAAEFVAIPAKPG